MKTDSLDKNTLISELSNYNLPHFVLEEIANECGSELVKKGKIMRILSSMNEPALRMLRRIFVNCEDDGAGKFSDYRFAVFVSSILHSKVMFNQSLKGESGTTYHVKIVAVNDHGLIGIGENRAKGKKVSVDELQKFNSMVKDLAKSAELKSLANAFFGSSTGYSDDFKEAFTDNVRTKGPVDKYGHEIPRKITILEFVDKNTNRIFTAPF